MLKRQLNQQEIEQYFENGGKTPQSPAALPGASFDFRSLGRIAQSQINSLRYLHDRFIRGLSSSLSVYLRSFVSAELKNVEQIQYAEFADMFNALTCVAYLNMSPYEGQAVLEISPALLSVTLDLMLGGSGKLRKELNREVTEVETDLLGGLFRTIVRDLSEAWKPVGSIGFEVDVLETRPQSSRRIVGSEAMVAVAIELKIGNESGLLNLAIPSSAMKAICQRIDGQSSARRSASKETELAIKDCLSKELSLDVKCEIHGVGIRLRDLVSMKVGDVLDLGAACNGRAMISVGDKQKFAGEFVELDSRLAVAIDSVETSLPTALAA